MRPSSVKAFSVTILSGFPEARKTTLSHHVLAATDRRRADATDPTPGQP
jgi:hypothetical protein